MNNYLARPAGCYSSPCPKEGYFQSWALVFCIENKFNLLTANTASELCCLPFIDGTISGKRKLDLVW